MALESLESKIFSSQTDVWSFGILFHEIFTFGKVPYNEIKEENLLRFLQDGNRLHAISNLDENLNELMTGCWSVVPEIRPSFIELENRLHEFIAGRSELYGYIEAKVYAMPRNSF